MQRTLSAVPLLLIFYNFCANLSNDIYLPNLPALVSYFDTNMAAVELTMSTWFMGVAISQIFLGPLSDRYGRRPILLIGGFCFLFATLLSIFSQNINTLLIGRFFQGVGVGSLNVSCYAILLDAFDYKRRTKIMAKMNSIAILAPMIGPLVGGYLYTLFGWQSNFILLFLLVSFVLISLCFYLPETNLSLNVKALHLKSLFKNYYSVYKNKHFFHRIITYCFLLGGLVAYLTAAPFIIIEKLEFSVKSFGLTQFPVFVFFIIGSYYLNLFLDENNIKKFLIRGLSLIFIASTLMIISSLYFKDNIFILILPIIIYVIGLSFCSSPLIAEAMESIKFHKGLASSLLGFGMAASCATATFILQIIFNGTILSLASILFGISIFSSSLYLFASNKVEEESETSSSLSQDV